MELVSVIYPSEIVFLYINDGYDDTATIDASIIMNEVHIAENFGRWLECSNSSTFSSKFYSTEDEKGCSSIQFPCSQSSCCSI